MCGLARGGRVGVEHARPAECDPLHLHPAPRREAKHSKPRPCVPSAFDYMAPAAAAAAANQQVFAVGARAALLLLAAAVAPRGVVVPKRAQNLDQRALLFRHCANEHLREVLAPLVVVLHQDHPPLPRPTGR